MESHATFSLTTSNIPDPSTSDPMNSGANEIVVDIPTPPSIKFPQIEVPNRPPTFSIPKDLTQEMVDVNPQLKRLQQDLLILTSFNENETLHWRPSWFKQESFSERFWTLQNPPNVITERIPHVKKGWDYYTRRMRRYEDSPPTYIKNWDHWRQYCDLYGVPYDYLCEEQVKLMRMGLPRDNNGSLCGKDAARKT